MKKIFLMLLILCLVISSAVSCGRNENEDTDETSSDETVVDESGANTESDNKIEDSSKETTEETTEVIVYDNWPVDDIKAVIGEDIPHYTGEFSIIEAVDASYGKMLPFIDLTILDVKADELNAYEDSLVNEGYVLSGTRRYCKKVSDAHIIIEFVSGENSSNAYISVGRIEDEGSSLTWPSSEMAEKFEYVPSLPVVDADSFDIEIESYAVSGIDVVSAVIVCYGVDSGAKDSYVNALIADSFVKSGSGAEAVYQSQENGYIVTVGVINIPLIGESSAMVITVASVVDAASAQHVFPSNFKCVYNDLSNTYTATKIGNDYMLAGSSEARFYKYDAQQGNWSEYTAGSGLSWSSTGETYSRSDVEYKVFGFMTDSNTAIYTDENETKSCCGVDAKVFTWEYEEGTTIYKLKHPTSGLILEIGVVELEIATSTVTEYTTNVTGFDHPTP